MRLGDFLSTAGFSVRDFAKAVNVTEAAMSRYVSGKRLPRAEIMQRIVEATEGEVEPNDFFECDSAVLERPVNGSAAVSEPTKSGGRINDEAASFLLQHPDVRWVDAMIPDICGIPRGKRLDVSALNKLFTTGIVLPGSTYALDMLGNNIDSTGMGPNDGDPDFPCHPVPGTLAPVPWLGPQQAQVLMIMSDDKGHPWWLDPRHIVRGMADKIEQLGYRATVAIELEFYLLEQEPGADGRPRPARSPVTGKMPSDTQVYLMDELDAYAPLLNDMVAVCREQSIPTDVATIEYAPGQFEINLHHTDDPVAACDHAMLQKRAIKGVAAKHGLAATFMARPFREYSTSGTHIHLSLVDDQGRNVFDDGSARGSKIFRHAIGGLASTMAEAMPIWAPNANSFRRITPTGWVPLAPTWGYNNRTVSLRVPGGPNTARRIEHRPAGADANPYLVMAAVLAGVHHGITNNLDPGDPIEGNAAVKVNPSLPAIWVDALRAFDAAVVLPDYFGAEYWDVYSKLKWAEFHEFNDHVSNLEYDRLLTLI
ncbi:MAG: glutamine synthetase [Rhodospirillaceae bacterium]|nr:glutamine synthetase [Rhodospirillaceae bacterium]|tara:strand:+ start:24417 stop:26030 length:1614 start_codon:yes stop_codon:yes gene_type:complete